MHARYRNHHYSMFQSLAILAVMCTAANVACADRYHPERGRRASAPATLTAAAVEPAERTADFWYEEARRGINARKARSSSAAGKAKNVVMFLGDGMSVPTLAAARTLLGQRQGRAGEEANLSFENFPTIGLVKVSS